MSFSRKEYLFSHTMTRVTQANQPTVFKIDLRELIPCYGCSALFVIDNMSVTAYKQSTLEKIPVKFTVLDENKKRVLTNDPCKLSSKWHVETVCRSYVTIAGTDTVPFDRSPPVCDEDNKQALANVLAFMMSSSLWVSDRARGAFDILVNSTRGEFEFTCDVCSEIGFACVMEGPDRLSYFSSCEDDYVCIPSQRPCADEDYVALRNLLTLLRSASLDNLDVLNRVTEEMAADRTFQELDCTSFPPRQKNGNVAIPYELMKRVTSLYQTMSEYADNFAIIDNKTSNVKVLIESPSANIGVYHHPDPFGTYLA
ncbi:hypothetical protein D5F01_LYC24050 [Larimichthys crocea]|uniref:Uncharacterized protein n=1 Tax=Larimichthys crocea TaxID=215358 RepID=A0A6G0HFY0_LARCR|nr:hypothetical protein D5F01_LYC25228 [Larimichthys crocea]KAE8277931.1 hypothetical protein D5F01_LYC24050 [Larimichthys crocea]